MRTFLRQLLADKKGATAVEYALIISLIVIACVTAIMGVADETISMWSNVAAVVSKS